MFVYCLADFFNLRLWKRGQPASYSDTRDGLEDLVAASLEVLGEHLGKVTELTIRLYGGWHDRETRSATQLRDLTEKVIRLYPRRIGVRLRLQIAEAFVGYPHLLLRDTVRRTPYIPSSRLAPTPPSCILGGSCNLSYLTSWLSGKCPEADCPVRTQDIILTRQQKLVDTLLTADALHLVYSKEADMIIIASDDDDMVPALLAAGAAGIPTVQLTRRANFSSCYDGILELNGVKFHQW